MSVLAAITCPYAILKGRLFGSTLLLFLLVPHYTLANYCHMGQIYVNQVGCCLLLVKRVSECYEVFQEECYEVFQGECCDVLDVRS